MKKIFSFDAETNGLWGQAFAIGALVYDENGVEIARFVARMPDEHVSDEWVREKVLPQLAGLSITHQDFQSMLADFAKFYLANKADADVIVHMGVPVESTLLKEMHSLGLIGDWDGPYPLIDVSGLLVQASEDPTSVDGYVRKYGLEVPDFGTTHNPLYDSAVAAVVYRHLLSRRSA